MLALTHATVGFSPVSLPRATASRAVAPVMETVKDLTELEDQAGFPGLGFWDPLGFTGLNLFDFGEQGSIRNDGFGVQNSCFGSLLTFCR